MNIGISMPFRIQLEDSLIIQPSDDSDVVIKANSLGSDDDYDEDKFQFINESENSEFPRLRLSNSRQSAAISNKFENESRKHTEHEYISTISPKLITPDTHKKKEVKDHSSSLRDIVYQSKSTNQEKYSSIALVEAAKADLSCSKIEEKDKNFNTKTTTLNSSSIAKFRKAYDEFSKCLNRDHYQHKISKQNRNNADKNTKLSNSKTQSHLK